MARKLTIPYYRPTFEEKTLGEVGDGTAYPMECTLDQVAEIFFRVKDASFISGNAGVGTGDPTLAPEFIGEVISPTAVTSDKTAYSNYLSRGYTTWAGDVFVPVDPYNEPYLNAEYDAGGGFMARDIADDELGMWLQMILPDWNSLDTGFVTAFSFNQTGGTSIWSTNPEHVFRFEYGFTPPYPLDPPTVEDVDASVVFSGRIGVVKESASDSIFAAGNRYFIGLEFRMETTSSGVGFVEISTNETTLTGGGAQIPIAGGGGGYVQYVIRLASGDIECPLYLYSDNAATYPVTYGENFIHEATEWWPYADGEGNPVWDTLTGLPA